MPSANPPDTVDVNLAKFEASNGSLVDVLLLVMYLPVFDGFTTTIGV
jgi:hypothetical protein